MHTFAAFACLVAVTASSFAGCPSGGAGTLYVDHEASSGGNGLSWSTAFQSLQAALSVAAGSPGTYNTIRVADGDYSPGTSATDTYNLVSGVLIEGRFEGVSGIGTSTENCKDGFTAFNGSSVYHVFTGANLASGTGLLDVRINGGFETRSLESGGRAGAGLTCTDSTITIQNVEFLGGSSIVGGGGCGFYGSNATLTCCFFQKCTADDRDQGETLGYGSGANIWAGDSEENFSVVTIIGSDLAEVDTGSACASGSAVYFETESDGVLRIKDGSIMRSSGSSLTTLGGQIHMIGGVLELSNSFVAAGNVNDPGTLASTAIALENESSANIVSSTIGGGFPIEASCAIGVDATSSAEIVNTIMNGFPTTEFPIDAVRVAGSLTMTNCTITEWTGAAVVSVGSGTGTICNTICWLNGEQGNETATDDIIGATDFLVSHSIIQQTIDSSWTSCWMTDPLFIDDDLRPSVCSIANGNASEECLPLDDLDVNFNMNTTEQLPLDCPKFDGDPECTNHLIPRALARKQGPLDIGAREIESGTRSVDWNNDGVIDFFDYLDFVADSSNNDADFNGDTVTDLFDYLDFVGQFSTCYTP